MDSVTDIVEYLPVKEKKTFRRRYGVALKAFVITLNLLIVKEIIDLFGWSLITVNPLLTAFLGGVFFTIGILFAGAVSDYKEAEKIPGELAVSLKALYKDVGVIPLDKKYQHLIHDFRQGVKRLLYAINENFRSNDWKLRVVDEELNAQVEATGLVRRTLDVAEALQDADYVHTDTFMNMEFFEGGQVKPEYAVEYERRKQVFMPYQLNADLINTLAPKAKIMHCMPCHVGYEISRDAVDHPNSIIFDQAENRLHMQKAIMLKLLNKL